MTTKTNAVGIHLTPDQHAALLDVAARLGCLSLRGPQPRPPSLRVLLVGIASGDIVALRAKTGKGRTRSESFTDAIEAELKDDPNARSSDIAARVGCSISLVSKIRRRPQS